MTARPLHRAPRGETFLCDPYRYVHRIPFWTGRLHETELEGYMRSEVKPGDTVIDVGANYGHVTVLGAALVGPGGRVYSFEPIPRLAKMVGEHCAHQMPQVEVFAAALGAESATATLSISSGDEGMSTLRPSASKEEWERVDVRILRGDDALVGRPMPGRVFLKVDVEGYEASVLSGLRGLLDSRVDHAVVEMHTPIIGRTGVNEAFAILEASGFGAQHPATRGPLTSDDVTEEQQVLFTSVRGPVRTAEIVVKAVPGRAKKER